MFNNRFLHSMLGCRARASVMGLALALTATAVAAGQYYRWIDSSGHLYIGDQPPPGGVTGFGPVPIPEYAPPERLPKDDPYSIINQTKRLQEQREALAKARQEKQRADREYLLRKRELEALQQPQPQQDAPIYVVPQVYYDRRPFRPWHPKVPHQGPRPARRNFPGYIDNRRRPKAVADPPRLHLDPGR